MQNLTPIQRYDFRKALEELESYKGRATELISLYIPAGKIISDVTSYLRNEHSQSSNIKSKSTRKNVTAAIESIMSRLKNIRIAPENGLAFFVGHIPIGADQTRMITRVVEPPSPITTFLYRCDSYFYLDHLRDMLAEDELYGLIVVDRAEATIGLLSGKKIEVIKNIQSLVPSKHGRGGQSAQRFERLIEIAAHEYFKKVGDLANEAFLSITELKGLLIGGPGSTKDFFKDNDYLHHELRKKVIESFDTGYTDEYGLRELLEKARPTLSHLEVSREKDLMSKLFTEIRKEDGGLSAYGLKDVMSALNAGAVQILLVSEGLNMYHVDFECPSCDETSSVTGSLREPPAPMCPVHAIPMEETESKDLVDELALICDSYSSDFELISMDSSEGEMLMKAFGGVAAVLRYKISY
ncbi:MAG: peptide chain release factor aRF-1 [Candidatus Thermoplasmatota archaeon]|nr:peptide chain release factor aRF-1 [Candidatus Thermoplasmatota archaeon]